MPGCKRCGECCTWVGIELDERPTAGSRRYMELHGIRVEERFRDTPVNVEGQPYKHEMQPIYVMMIPCKCKALIFAYGETRCKLKTITEDLRPANCKTEPTHLWHHPNSCKFFEED